MISTKTSKDQKDCENACLLIFNQFNELLLDEKIELKKIGFINNENQICLLRENHIQYLLPGLSYLGSSFITLDASRPWIIYWIIHSLELLNHIPIHLNSRIINTLNSFQNKKGGYGGGPNQISHTATTYSSCLTLAMIGTKEAYDSVNRNDLYQFFLSRKDRETGAFSAHEDGEVDVRVTYCVIAIADLYNILTEELTNHVVNYVLSCQTYEGGFGGEPGNEAHGGYAFCAVAILSILKSLHLCDMDSLLYWNAHRQMKCEGGYQGRTNKLVDGCYSFWQGAIPIIISNYYKKYTVKNSKEINHLNPLYMIKDNHLIIDSTRLEKYILLCCQQLQGGLRDKPGKPRDYYHSCYCLSGLSLVQNSQVDNHNNINKIYGDPNNLLIKTDPIYNISCEKAEKIKKYFVSRPF